MFRRDGCPWCAKWDREIGPIYPKTEFNLRAPLRQVNLDRGRDPSIVHAPIHYTPTFVLVEDGKEVGRIEGYPGDEFFWVRLENLLERSPRPAQGNDPRRFAAAGATAIVRGPPDEGPRPTSSRHAAAPKIKLPAGLDIDMHALQRAAGERIPQGAVARGEAADPLLSRSRARSR